MINDQLNNLLNSATTFDAQNSRQGTIGIWQYDPSTSEFTWMHNFFQEPVTEYCCGYTYEPLEKLGLYCHEDFGSLMDRVDDVIKTGAIGKGAILARALDCKNVWCQTVIFPLLDAEQKVTKVLGFVVQINAIWSSLLQTGKSSGIFHNILNSIPIDFVIFDTQHRFLYISEMAVKDAELRNWLIGKTEFDYCQRRCKPTDIAERRHQVFLEAMATRKNTVYEEKLDWGEKTEYKMRGFHPILTHDDEVIFVVGYGTDITAAKRSEEIIQKQHAAIESAKDGIGLLDKEGNYYFINKAHANLFGYEPEELIGKSWKTLYRPEEIVRIERELFPLLQSRGKWTGETLGKCKNGMPVAQEITLTPLEDGGLICICRDVSDIRKQTEELKNLALVVENTNSFVLITNRDIEIIWANKAFLDHTGFVMEELHGKNPGLVLNGPDTDQATVRYIEEQISKGKEIECEIIDYTKSKVPYWVKMHGRPMLNEQGEIDKYFFIQENITNLKKIEQELIIAKNAAEASARAKRRFLANMSHEIRTPMNAVMGLTEQLLKTELSGKQEFFAKTIQTAADNLLTVINDILDLSKIEEGKLQLEYLPINLHDVLDRVKNVLQHKAEEKGILFNFNLDKFVLTNVLGDPYRLNQILLNIIGNAIKFTEKGSVTIHCSRKSLVGNIKTILITIEDTGIGMDEEMLHNAFTEFHQEDQSFVRKFGGTGLGLSISKTLVELMGGQIKMESQKGVGTKVTLEIPMQLAEEPAKANIASKEEDLKKLKGRTVLLAEDNKFNSLVASIILKNAGLQVTLAENGEEAVEKVKENKFDLILMDIQMPVMDGVNATQIIRSEICKETPIIALTAHALREEKDLYLQSGMNDFITKPFQEKDLLQLISKWIPKKDKMFNIAYFSEYSGMGTPEIKMLLNTFIEELVITRTSLIESYHHSDWVTIKRLAHKIKPSFMMLGLEQFDPLLSYLLAIDEKAPEQEKLKLVIDEFLSLSTKLEHEINQFKNSENK